MMLLVSADSKAKDALYVKESLIESRDLAIPGRMVFARQPFFLTQDEIYCTLVPGSKIWGYIDKDHNSCDETSGDQGCNYRD